MYVLPGFIDMHGRIGGEPQGADWDYVFKLWLAHGITTIREPSGRGIKYAVDLKKEKKMKLLHQGYWHILALDKSKSPISNEEQAREWVRQNAKNGADGIKFFGAEPVMKAALDENKKLGLRSACHHAQLSVARWNVLNSARADLPLWNIGMDFLRPYLKTEQFSIP